MKFIVENEILKTFKGVKLGVVFGFGINNFGKSETIKKLLEKLQRKQTQKFLNVNLSTYGKIAPWREIYSKFGAKPSKYNSSIESLLKRIKLGGKLPNINNLVDLYNAMSLKYELPFGAEDLNKVRGDIKFAFAKGDESGKYIGSDKIDTCEKGEVAYLDDLGFICRRWNWREADRTKITEETKNFVLVAEALPPMTNEDLSSAIEEFIRFSEKYLGGHYKNFILDKDNPVFEIDFKTGSRVTEKGIKGLQISVKKPNVSLRKVSVREKQAKEYIAISKIITDALNKILGVNNSNIEFTENEEFGDYSSNIAMAIFSKFQIPNSLPSRQAGKFQTISKLEISKFKNPRELAESIVVKLSSSQDVKPLFEKIEVAGPGFINFWLKEDVLIDNLNQIERDKEKYGSSQTRKGKTVVIDYSSPNIAKRFSIGHLRSTIIGQALYNIYKFIGWTTIGDNHLGDWGTQFGVLIYMVKKENLDPGKLTVDDWEKLYVNFHKELETKKELEGVAAEEFRKLEKGDSEARNIWQAALKTSTAEYERIYDLLGVKIDYVYGESFYEDKMANAVEKAKKKGILVKSKGAWVIEFDKKYNLPSNVLVKSNGATTYLTRDLALLFFRKEKWNPDLQIFEVGSEQSLYFKQVFAMAEMMELFNLNQLKHTAHGQYLASDGKRFSTRSGKTIKLEDVLDEAIDRAKKLGNTNAKTAVSVGIGAIKYFDLMHSIGNDVLFDWEKMMNMEGNSGPYLQYTAARANSVLRKAELPITNYQFSNKLQIRNYKLEIEEELVLRALVRFSEVILSAAKNYSPNILCSYLFDLAQKFNSFYNAHRIISDESTDLSLQTTAFRLRLTSAVGQVLKNGLKLLGIQAPERM